MDDEDEEISITRYLNRLKHSTLNSSQNISMIGGGSMLGASANTVKGQRKRSGNRCYRTAGRSG